MTTARPARGSVARRRAVRRHRPHGIGSDLLPTGLVSHNTVRYGLIGLTFSLVTWLFCGAVLVVSAAVLGALVDQRIVRSG
jgi:hypothetical protein